MRRVSTSAALVWTLVMAQPAGAQLVVTDPQNLVRWLQQTQQMKARITQLTAQVRALRDIPQNLISQTEGLIQTATSNPLGQITQNLQTLLNGSGPGNCGNAQINLTSNNNQTPTGTDLSDQLMTQNINRQAGLLACTQQMMTATQTAMPQIQALVQQLAGATDVTQATAISGRIMGQIAVMQGQQQQAQLLASEGLLQTQLNENKILEKQRSDSMKLYNSTLPGAAAGTVPTVQPFAAPGT
jgi:hypothetical protein